MSTQPQSSNWKCGHCGSYLIHAGGGETYCPECSNIGQGQPDPPSRRLVPSEFTEAWRRYPAPEEARLRAVFMDGAVWARQAEKL